jgi:hypothetical protein
MSGTLDLPTAPYTPKKQIRPADIYASSPDYTPAEKLTISTPDLLKQAKDAQALEEVPKKGGKSRRRKGGKKARKTRRRGRRMTKSRK